MEPTYTTRWFYTNLQKTNVTPGHKTCAVCGLPTVGDASRTKTIRPTFTDHTALRAPRSPVVCAACDWYMSRQDLRRSSWWLTPTQAQPLAKADLWPTLQRLLVHPPDQDGYLLITTMKRKHLALHAPLNLSGCTSLRVRFEVVTLNVAPAWLDVVAAAHALRQNHSWREIQSDNYVAKFLTRWPNPLEFIRHRQVIQPHLHTPHLDLAQYVWSKNR
jgi:CRISPR type IV-associated protein Csf1